MFGSHFLPTSWIGAVLAVVLIHWTPFDLDGSAPLLGLAVSADPLPTNPSVVRRPVPVVDAEDTAIRIQEALSALRANGSDPQPHFVLGSTYYEIGNLVSARHHLEVYLDRGSGPDSVEAAYLHARTLLKLGMRLRATRAFRALSKAPLCPPEAHHDLSLLLRDDGFRAEAIMAGMRALERGGLHEERLRESAYQWKEIRRHDQAGAMFRQLVGLEGEALAEDHFQLAYLAHRTKRYDVAATEYQACLALDPTHAEAHYNASMVSERDDEIDRATFHLEQVLRLRPHYEPAYFQLGRLFLEHDRSTEAADVFRRFLVFGQDSLALVEARHLLDRLETPETP